MAYPFTKTKTYLSNEILTASDLNSSLDDIVNNNIPENIDDYSSDAAEMRSTADPYPAAAESLATSLSEELQRLRYQLTAILGETYWYIDPDRSIASLATLLGTSSTQGLFPDGTAALPSISFTNDPNSGVYSVSADKVGISVGGALRFSVDEVGGYLTSGLSIQVPSAALPATPQYTFTGDLDTGFYNSAVNRVACSTGGGARWEISSGGFELITGVFATPDGSAAAPPYTFTADPNSGMYRLGADRIGLAVGGSLRFELNEGTGYSSFYLAVKLPDGLSTVPSLTFTNDPNSGLYSAGADQLGLVTGGVENARIDSDATAGNTRLLIYDVDNATLERISVGVADSGGAGYKVLRIPN